MARVSVVVFRSRGVRRNTGSDGRRTPQAALAASWSVAGFCACSLLAVYISLVPFDFEPKPLWLALGRFWREAEREINSVTNFAANILLFVPIGAFGAGAWIRTGRGARTVIEFVALLLGSATLSMGIEFLQVFTRTRTPSFVDIGAHGIGVLIGIVAWSSASPRIDAWVADRDPARRVRPLLLAYLVAWAIVMLMPLDVTFSVSALAMKYRAGQIVVNPFESLALTRDLAPSLASAFVLCAPVGYLLTATCLSGRSSHGITAAILGTVLVALTELAQVFIMSRHADIGDVVTGSVGISLGAWLAVARSSTAREASTPAPNWALVGLLLALVACIAYSWAPFDFVFAGDFVRPRLGRLLHIPFEPYYVGVEAQALTSGVVKVAMGVPLGALAIASIRHAQWRCDRWTIAYVVAVAALFLTGVELGQCFLPSRYPDSGDVLVTTAGVWLGAGVSRWLGSGTLR